MMDIQMPKKDGIEAAKEIHEIYKGSKTPPLIVAVTANVMKSDLEKYKKAGMVDVLAKPIKSKMLMEVLNKHSRF